jgi:AcrR family transcriptional regulator
MASVGLGRSTYHHGNLRRALVDSAAGLLAARGVHGVTLRAAARAAGVSQAAPYRHFADKEALLAAVAEEGFQAMNAAIRSAVAGADGDAAHRLEAVAVGYVRFAAEHPALYRLMWSPTPSGRAHPPLRAAADAAGAALLALIDETRDAGQRTAQPPVDLLFVLWALLHGVASLVVDEQLPRDIQATVPVEMLAVRAIQVLNEGLRHSRSLAVPQPGS